MNKGSYLLFIELSQDIVVTIAGKKCHIKNGLYSYVGSAMKNLRQRINRHISYHEGNYKKHWHVDHLLEKGRVISTLALPNEKKMEEELSLYLASLYKTIPGFGATDCKSVNSNLFFLSNNLEDYFCIIRKVLEYNCNTKTKA